MFSLVLSSVALTSNNCLKRPTQPRYINYQCKIKLLYSAESPELLNREGVWSVGSGGEARGVWVDDVWYNVTWVDRATPYFNHNGVVVDENGRIVARPFIDSSQKSYWMEGVQYFIVTYRNDAVGVKTCYYLNMNGTWVDVTGRVVFDREETEPAIDYRTRGTSVSQSTYYQKGNNNDDGFGLYGLYISKSIDVGDNAFDNRFAPGESRLLVIYGSLDVRTVCVESNGGINPADAILSEITQTKVIAHTYIDIDPFRENNTFINTHTVTTSVQQIVLSRVGNSYLYNTVLSDNQMFQLDQYGAEVFIVPIGAE